LVQRDKGRRAKISSIEGKGVRKIRRKKKSHVGITSSHGRK